MCSRLSIGGFLLRRLRGISLGKTRKLARGITSQFRGWIIRLNLLWWRGRVGLFHPMFDAVAPYLVVVNILNPLIFQLFCHLAPTQTIGAPDHKIVMK
jgi:hypothetical protein